MKLGLSVREQRTILIGGLLAILVLWMYGALIVSPLMRESSDLGDQVRLAHEQLRGLEAVTANQGAVEAQHRQMTDTVKSLRSLLPAEEELPSIIELLSGLASQAHVKIQTIFPQRPGWPGQESADGASTKTAVPAEPLVYKDVIIQIDAQAGYHQLGTFLSLIESGKKPMEVSSLRMSADPKESRWHTIKLLVRSYFATSGSSNANAALPAAIASKTAER